MIPVLLWIRSGFSENYYSKSVEKVKELNLEKKGKGDRHLFRWNLKVDITGPWSYGEAL